ncbi:MAG: hypothetical protein OSA97_11800, partial [Nevskia sp.]|nr:hypothetical protein [Nevskia sp.]
LRIDEYPHYHWSIGTALRVIDDDADRFPRSQCHQRSSIVGLVSGRRRIDYVLARAFPLVVRLLVAPLFWPKLLLGVRLRPLERQIVNAILESAPANLSAVLADQFQDVNYVQRTSVDWTEVALYKMTLSGPTHRRRKILPFTSETKIADVTLTMANGQTVKSEVICISGYVFLVKFNSVVNLEQKAAQVVVVVGVAHRSS